jgi:hypothetical protein
MSKWHKRSEERLPSDTYVWLFDSDFDEVVVSFMYAYAEDTVDPSFTHWMEFDEETEEPSPPDED